MLCTFVSPFRSDRERLRGLFPEGRFLEIHIAADVETCSRRDPKGLYRRALAGEIADFTGVSSPYEEPDSPELRVDTTRQAVEESVESVIGALRESGVLRGGGG